MAEVFGAVAAASQLAASCVKFLDLLRKIKGVPSSVKDYQTQLQELQGISRAISSNALLQTPEIGALTFSLVTVVDSNSLRHLLQHGRFYRSCIFLLKEREIFDHFQAIERRKTSLSLAMSHIQAQTLHQIQSTLGTMPLPGSTGDSDTSLPSVQKRFAKEVLPLIHSETFIRLTSDASAFRHTQAMSKPEEPIAESDAITFHNSNNPGYSRFGRNLTLTTEEELVRSIRMFKAAQRESPGCSVSVDNIACDGSQQRNGPIFSGQGKGLIKTVQSYMANAPRIYQNNRASVTADQQNAMFVDYTGDDDIQFPGLNEFHTQCDTFEAIRPMTGHVGLQSNAPHFRFTPIPSLADGGE